MKTDTITRDSQSVTIFTELIGKTIVNIEQIKDEEIYFTFSDSKKYKMYHDQGCCEDVHVEDVTGDLQDLINSPLLQAEEVSQDGESEWDMSATWTFYKFSTVKGSVTIRWLGESNGYYSESVDFEEVEKLNEMHL